MAEGPKLDFPYKAVPQEFSPSWWYNQITLPYEKEDLSQIFKCRYSYLDRTSRNVKSLSTIQIKIYQKKMWSQNNLLLGQKFSTFPILNLEHLISWVKLFI